MLSSCSKSLKEYRKYDMLSVLSEYRKFKPVRACFGREIKVIKLGDFVRAYSFNRKAYFNSSPVTRSFYYGRVILLYETCCRSVVALIKVFNKGDTFNDDVHFVWDYARNLEKTTKEKALVELL